MARLSITSYLIKEEYYEFRDVIREDIEVEYYQLNEELNLNGIIVVGYTSKNSPQWLQLLQSGSNSDLPELLNSSSRAILFVRSNDRIFAFPFGFGRYLLKDEAIVKDFGIKVVLNSVDPQKLRSIDTATISEMTIHSRTQTSRTTNVNTFGIDVVKDFLKSVTGEPTNEDFGTIVTGRESVQFSYDFEDDFRKFGVICTFLEEKYNSDSYRENFSWVDNLQIVNDSVLKRELDQKLIDNINVREKNKLHIAPPEIIDWNDIGGFSFTEHGNKINDLSIEEYFDYITKFDEFGLEKFKRHSVYTWDNSNDNRVAKWKLYDCVVFETVYEDEIYVLTVGIWFKINHDFANSVEEYVRNIPTSSIDLPPCKQEEKEGEYNLRVGQEVTNMITLDTKNVMYQGSKIEICDLMSNEKHLIHVKPWKSSSTLSHLFSQGRVSSESLFQDVDFRKASREKISEINEGYVEYISEDHYDPSEIEVVYAIIDSSDRELHERLPFFSKLNMMQSVKHLRNIRYHVTQLKIRREIDNNVDANNEEVAVG
ncbi:MULTISPECIES: DUF6119 family protein [Bacillus amyloliquefaciens group]|uniref:DUF6119 family protein n=1 Tax=Bacillus amyloliquefaciens group TaxID=1938374 RepID=UPI00058FFB18|nr:MULTISPECIES: DUF6119 family protein [Bacillus amyloliquefaciens group]KMO09455.1 hypothetical protein TH57_01220 [Bacillus amyloliquefaciens]MDE5153619.1 TIGR04141 family sporadically distributed protein [Bacillus amyloliquefaciens]QGZ44706.1 hypothetical protein GPY14_07185 [Bacillus velezensis]QTG84069.1 TIGR04141 family sporadically distributed protein [Bacillus amyloliquefaciens]RBZ01348.1 hypothetical protein DSD26_03590 [Bacillus velezensis]